MAEEEEFGTYPVWFVVILLSFLIALILLIFITTNLVKSLGFVGVG